MSRDIFFYVLLNILFIIYMYTKWLLDYYSLFISIDESEKNIILGKKEISKVFEKVKDDKKVHY